MEYLIKKHCSLSLSTWEGVSSFSSVSCTVIFTSTEHKNCSSTKVTEGGIQSFYIRYLVYDGSALRAALEAYVYPGTFPFGKYEVDLDPFVELWPVSELRLAGPDLILILNISVITFMPDNSIKWEALQRRHFDPRLNFYLLFVTCVYQAATSRAGSGLCYVPFDESLVQRMLGKNIVYLFKSGLS